MATAGQVWPPSVGPKTGDDQGRCPGHPVVGTGVDTCGSAPADSGRAIGRAVRQAHLAAQAVLGELDRMVGIDLVGGQGIAVVVDR